MVQLIHAAAKDDDCHGFIVRIASLGSDLSNIALIKEIRMELGKAKSKGKSVVVYLDGWSDMSSYYLASVADEIIMPPMGTIHQLGIRYEVVKFNRLLDRFGVAFNSISSGKYKVATNPLSDSLSASQKEVLSQSIHQVFLTIQDDVRQARREDWLSIKPFFDGRFITSQQALDNGLIDHIGFWSDVPTIVKESFNLKNDIVLRHIDTFQNMTYGDYFWEA